MSERPSRHQRRASQTVFALPESLEAPPMEGGEKKTAAGSAGTSSTEEAAGPSPPSSAGLPAQELKPGDPKKQ
ncbi:hypothetical protein MUK42_13101 [Musa troglodytarum]|uniref:Uncharacterized protein n=1 Tax=Musa troglodytarum TaxID=320322 RepID=A0A9E7K7N0_9LILI|nr:hypothetical protein MUK42_13164 [Musa troglodytarum]URE07476.1 hypothetical protein MUK42_13101 [Musa troglodytarum]